MTQRQYARRKLQPNQVVLLRQMHREGFSKKFLAKICKINRSTINQILSYQTYKDVK